MIKYAANTIAMVDRTHLEALTGLLGDPEEDVRRETARAVGKLGGKAATKPILAALCRLLYDRETGVRDHAATALNALVECGARIPAA